MKHVLAAILILVAIAAIPQHDVARAQVASVPTCVMEAVQQPGGFSFPLACEDRARFTAPALTGGACTAPTMPGSFNLFTKLPDGSCLPISILFAPGTIASLPLGDTLPDSGTMTPAQLALVLRTLK